jgi:hypothetical protein
MCNMCNIMCNMCNVHVPMCMCMCMRMRMQASLRHSEAYALSKAYLRTTEACHLPIQASLQEAEACACPAEAVGEARARLVVLRAAEAERIRIESDPKTIARRLT